MVAAKKDSEKSEYIVAARRTLSADGKPIGPGEPFTADAEEVEHLVAAGFLVKVAALDPESSYGVSVGGLKILGGRKPGGVVA